MRLIDADALDAKVEEIKWLQESFAAALVFDAVMAIADGLPTIDAEPVRHSRMSNPSIKKVKPMCLECHIAYIKDSHWNYCPFCGAKMDLK